MSGNTPHAPGDVRLRQLVEVYCNELASDEEVAELEERLARDAAARSFFFRYLTLDAALASYADAAPPSPPRITPATAARWWAVYSMAAVAVVCVVGAVTVLFLNRGDEPPREHSQAIGVLKQLSGPVAVAGADGRVRAAQHGDEVNAGDTVRTRDSLSTATLAYPDGTRLSLVGKASLTIHGDARKSVTVHGGTVFASVAAQPAEQPMSIVTLSERLEFVGTQFVVDAGDGETELNVKSGSVRLTRLRDGRSVVVPAGQRVVSVPRSALIVEDIPPVADKWAIDFTDGLPGDWETGKLVASDLPSGARAAVRAVRASAKDGAPFEIATADHWTHGLFAVHDDSHLHFTFKMDEPGWFNILILTRTTDGSPPAFAGNYIFNEPGWQPMQAGRWFTAVIPLAAFRPLPPSRPAFEHAVPFQLLFSSPQADRRLTIAQIRVTRGGPGRVLTKEVAE